MCKQIIMLFITLLTYSFVSAQESDKWSLTLSGTIRDSGSSKKLESVSITLVGTNIATVSNADGFFSIKIPTGCKGGNLRVEQLGYHSRLLSVDSLRAINGNKVIALVSSAKMLKEVVVRSGKPEEIVAEALRKIPLNYSPDKSLFTAFYRETVQKGKRYIGVSEAMVDVLKSPYSRRDIYGERVRINKGRKLISQSRHDTISVKLVGGPTLPLILDFVKNGDTLFDEDYRVCYSFKMDQPISLDDRMQYVIRFEPKIKTNYALCHGILYIDQESLSFTKAEFELDMSDKNKATAALLRKKPRGLHFKPQEVAFTVTYKFVDGTSYLNYIHAKSRFKCDWKRRLFSSGYTTDAEMVMVDRLDNPQEGISRKMAFGNNDIFDDKVSEYWDGDFWQRYNIIEPTESLEKAVGKLLKHNSQVVAFTDFR